MLVLAASACGEPGVAERRWPVMGTYAEIEVHARTAASADALAEEIREAIDGVDRSMSNWSDDSEISRVNRAAPEGVVPVRDPDVFRCIKLARTYARATGGAFDPTVGPLMRLYGFRPHAPRVPSPAELAEVREHVGWRKFEVLPEHEAVRFLDDRVEIDLGGIAKGYALDVAVRKFAKFGSIGGLLDLGGGVYAWGTRADGTPWRVALRDPLDPERVIGSIDLGHRAVATSGNYENAFERDGAVFGHIMDASSGRPAASDLIAATVIADAGVEADALSTAFFAGGSLRAGEILGRSVRIEAVLVRRDPDGLVSVVASGSLRDRLEFTPAFLEAIEGRVRYLLPPEAL